MTKNDYKFNIEQKLNEIEFSARNKALKDLQTNLQVTSLTFYRWRRIKLGESVDIPSTKLMKIAKFFGCSMEELINPDEALNNIKAQSCSRKSLEEKYGMA